MSEMIRLEREPTFARCWDICLYRFLYPETDAVFGDHYYHVTPKYVVELETVLHAIGITRQSRILDTCSGSGFPALHLLRSGYSVDCMDMSLDQIQLFRHKAVSMSIDAEVRWLSWHHLPQNQNAYDMLLCRGNSLIYADGGWNGRKDVDSQHSLRTCEKTLRRFHGSLSTDGFLYVDKFKDNEKDEETTFAEILVDGAPMDLMFSHRIDRESNTRYATFSMKRGGVKETIPNTAYNLSGEELCQLCRNAGFRDVIKLDMETERFFDVFLAQK